MQNPVIKRFELVEVPVPASTIGKILFPSIAILRNQSDQQIIIKDIIVFNVEEYANSQLNSAIPNMDASDFPKAVLGLYVNGEETLHYIPLTMLNHDAKGLTAYYTNANGFADLTNVDFDKSYIQFSTATTSAAQICVIGINYLKNVRDPNNANNWIQA